MASRTPLYDKHVKQGGVMVDFAGWDMPLHYGSQIQEHHQVRKDAGMFDVSHMGIIDVMGEGAKAFLQILLSNNVDKLKMPGKALYSCMLNKYGGILDDLIVYSVSPLQYRLVVNASTTHKDLQWMQKIAVSYAVTLNHRTDLAIIAIQGPQAIKKIGFAKPSLAENLKMLNTFEFFEQDNFFVARTGYTGEDGVEVILPATEALLFWSACDKQGIQPVGLGARDTLRLEAGFNLYGQDMDETVTPFGSHLQWTVAFDPLDRAFMGREPLEIEKKIGCAQKLIGLQLQGKGVLRRHQSVICNSKKVGEITSGTFSPTLQRSIGFARIERDIHHGCEVEIRGKQFEVDIVETPFVRRK